MKRGTEWARGMLRFNRGARLSELLAAYRHWMNPTRTACGYSEMEKAIKLPFLVHELKKRGAL